MASFFSVQNIYTEVMPGFAEENINSFLPNITVQAFLVSIEIVLRIKLMINYVIHM